MNTIFSIRPLVALTIAICLCFPYHGQGGELPYEVTFQNLNVAEKIPSNNINVIYQDHIGFLWIGTGQGLYRYNGYTVEVYKNHQEQPHLLTSNNVLCLAADRTGHLWVGTDRGITRLHLATGELATYHLTDFDNTDHIAVMTITRDEQLWVGTKGGLYRYDATDDEFVLYCDQRGNSRVPHCSITSIMEDSQGYIWIGTWDRGLYRYDPANGTYYELPRFNDINSAHVVFEDHQGKLWVGTWGKGLYYIYNPHATGEPLQFKNYMCEQYPALPSNYIYSMATDPYTHMIWVGTSKGLTFGITDAHGVNFHGLPSSAETFKHAFGRGASHLLCDRDGHIWLNASLYGIVSASTHPRKLVSHPLPAPYTDSYNISALSYDNRGNLWIGIDNQGLLQVNASNLDATDRTHLLGQPSHPGSFKVNRIYQLHNRLMAFGTERDGLIIADSLHTITSYNRHNAPWMQDNCVYSIHEDDEHNLLLGTWMGLSILYPHGEGMYLTNEHIAPIINDARITHITPGKDCYWLSTRNKGIIRLTGNIQRTASLQATLYDKPLDTELPVTDVFKTIVDPVGRVWACSEAGLMLYDPQRNGFSIVNHRFGIPYDDIYSIEQGADSTLWLSSRHAIIHLQLSTIGKVSKLRLYSRKDGIDNYSFNKRFSCTAPNGTLCFASLASYTTIADIATQATRPDSPAYVSGIELSNISLRELHGESRQPIADALPPYTRMLTLAPEHRHLRFQFSSFNYDELTDENFAYRLDGYDRDWQYTESGNASAHYNNLPWGRYTLRLRSMNPDGSWSQCEQSLQIHIKSPLYLRWYAIVLYIALLTGLLLLIARYLQSRAHSLHEIELAHMEKEQLAQLNHNKLRFFTNITHDLMTPLTVILATTDKLQQESPQHAEDYKVIQNNLNRQIRLLQQILEFRKAETGNLHLQVSPGDVADFCRREIESIQPLMRTKELHLSLVCSPEHITGYFDPDNLDKVIYNLLSNAAKYNRPGGFIHVTLRATDDGNRVQLTVADNGKGIAPPKLVHIFERFYEGEHRKHSTYGTGIGLSLTRDLVELHHGTIGVTSQEGQGTTFTVELPIGRSAFGDDEIDDTTLDGQQPTDNRQQPTVNRQRTIDNRQRSTILIVEDNQELIDLITQLLTAEYRIVRSYNGKEALELMETDDIDLVITDVMMPVMSGMELTQQLRSNPLWSNIPIIMLTAKRAEEARAEAYTAGADAYITKPFSIDVLKARIDNLLLRKQQIAHAIKEIGLAGLGQLNLTSEDEAFVKRCVECVQRHLSDSTFDQQTFADEVNMSKSTLYKRLKSLTGMYTSAFIRHIRMRAACQLLEAQPHIRIAELAYAVGYNEPKYFSSCFKKDFGMLPTEYAEKQAGKKQ